MQRTNKLWIGASLLVLGVACGESETNAKELVSGAKEAAESADLSQLTPDAMKAKVGDLTSTITAKLSAIHDKASAMSAADAIGPIADQLSALKTKLGTSLPDMSALRTAVEDVTKKFALDGEVMGVLKPLLDKLQGLLS